MSKENSNNGPVGQFDRLSRNAMNIAENLSETLGHSYIGTEHLVYGILSQDISNNIIQVQIKHPQDNGFRMLIENIKSFAAVYEKDNKIKPTKGLKTFTEELQNSLDQAIIAVLTYGYNKVTVEHLFYGILATPNSNAKKVLNIKNAQSKEMVDFLISHFEDHFEMNSDGKKRMIMDSSYSEKNMDNFIGGIDGEDGLSGDKDKTGRGRANTGNKNSALAQYTTNLNIQVKSEKLFKIASRDDELNKIILTLCRKQKNNPIIIGEPGVGKTSLVELLADRINKDKVPSHLKGKQIYSLDLTSMIAGSIFRGEFEQKIKNLMKELIKNENIILFIDEIHTVVGAGSSQEKGLDFSNILKPYLVKGQVAVIGATTTDEYRTVIKKDKAFERRFQPITIEEPTLEETKEILMSIKESYEKFHNIEISSDVVSRVVELSSRYLQNRFFPDKAIDVLDEACSYRKLKSKRNNTKLSPEDINYVISKTTSIPLEKLNDSILTKISNLESILNSKIFGQKEAVSSLTKALKRSYSGVNYHTGPIASFIFLGPTGVGKTQLVKSLATELFGNEKISLLKIDMSELTEKHSISRLTGTSAGYVGYDDAPQLTEFLSKHPNSIILLDEIEKGHPQILNLLLQMLEDGYITDGKGVQVSCKDCIIILTSNIGMDELNKKAGQIGFSTASEIGYHREQYNETRDSVLKSLSKSIKPEILGRLTDKIVFNAITPSVMELIVRNEINYLSANLSKKGKLLTCSNELIEYIIELACKKSEYGARDVKRIIQDKVMDPISESIIASPKQFAFEIDMDKGMVTLKKPKTKKTKSSIELGSGESSMIKSEPALENLEQ